MTLLIVSAEFAKSYVAAHSRTLPNGKVVQVHAFSDKRYKQALRDTHTPDMFKPELPAPQKKIPAEAAKNPQDFTPDLFTGESKKQAPSREKRESLESQHRDRIAKEPAVEHEFRAKYNALVQDKEDGVPLKKRAIDVREWVNGEKIAGRASQSDYDKWIGMIDDVYNEKPAAAGLKEGSRVSVDMSAARASLPKVKGQLSPEGVRLTRTLEEIVDGSGQRPFITADYGSEVEIASSNYGEGMKTLRIPKSAVKAEQDEPRKLSPSERGVVFSVPTNGIANTPGKPANTKPNASAVSGELAKMGRDYHPTIPVSQALAMAAKHGLHGIDEDGTPWEGMLTGRDGRTTIELADASGKVVNAMAMQWHKMDSGKYEFNAYLTGTPLHKSQPRILFFKSHVKEFRRKDGTVVKEHDDKRTKKMVMAGPGRQAAKPDAPAPVKSSQAEPGSAHGYGAHNVEAGDTLKFKAGDFAGAGKVKSAGKDGAVVTDESGRDHNVHWGEVMGRKGAESAPEAKPESDAPQYEPRNEGETDKQYAKRAVDKMDSPKSLPEDHDKYFNTEGATHVPMENLHSTKSDEENQQGGDNGPKRMQAAAHGKLSKRDPITVMPHADKAGHFEVVDGNGTHTSAKNLGWKSLPTKIVSREEGQKQIAADKAKDAAKANAGKKKFFDPAEVEKLPHKDNVKQSTFNSWESAAKAGPVALKEYDGLLNNLSKSCGFEIGKGNPDSMTDEQLNSDMPYVFMGPMKQEEKSTKKVNTDYKGDWSMLKDLVRATIAVKSIDDVHTTLAGLKSAGLEFAQKPKDNMSNGNKDGYRDLNLILKLPETGMLVELQIAVKQISKVKGEAHHYYNENIKLDQDRKEAMGELSKNSVGEPKALYNDNEELEQNWPDKGAFKTFMSNRKKQQEIYGGAWAKVPGIDQILKALMALGGKMIAFFKGPKNGYVH